MKVWTDLLGSEDAPYDFELETEAGTRYEARPPWPNVEVVGVDNFRIEEFVQQVLRVKATMPEDGVEQDLIVNRIVARLQGGGEVEIKRMALPTESIIEEVDISRCGACGDNIVPGDAVILDTEEGRAAFHQRCVV